MNNLAGGEAGGGGGGSTTYIHLDRDAAATMMAEHRQAARRISRSAGAVPGVDAGDDGGALAAIMRAVLANAIDLEDVNDICATQLKAAMDDVLAVDADVAGIFRVGQFEVETDMRRTMPSYGITPPSGPSIDGDGDGQPDGPPGYGVQPPPGFIDLTAPPSTGGR